MFSNIAIYQINLDRRVDRWNECIKNHAEMGFVDNDIQRISAVADAEYGILGCTKSHVKVLCKLLTEDSGEYCIVLEDDFDFKVNKSVLAERLAAVRASGVDWNVILLAGTNVRSFAGAVPHLSQVFEAFTTSGYIIKRSYLPALINCFINAAMNLERVRHFAPRPFFVSRFALDVAWQSLQRTDRWYIFTPSIGSQRPSFSDIENKHVDYHDLAHK